MTRTDRRTPERTHFFFKGGKKMKKKKYFARSIHNPHQNAVVWPNRCGMASLAYLWMVENKKKKQPRECQRFLRALFFFKRKRKKNRKSKN
jgi:hypothetical protein